MLVKKQNEMSAPLLLKEIISFYTCIDHKHPLPEVLLCTDDPFLMQQIKCSTVR